MWEHNVQTMSVYVNNNKKWCLKVILKCSQHIQYQWNIIFNHIISLSNYNLPCTNILPASRPFILRSVFNNRMEIHSNAGVSRSSGGRQSGNRQYHTAPVQDSILPIMFFKIKIGHNTVSCWEGGHKWWAGKDLEGSCISLSRYFLRETEKDNT